MKNEDLIVFEISLCGIFLFTLFVMSKIDNYKINKELKKTTKVIIVLVLKQITAEKILKQKPPEFDIIQLIHTKIINLNYNNINILNINQIIRKEILEYNKLFDDEITGKDSYLSITKFITYLIIKYTNEQ